MQCQTEYLALGNIVTKILEVASPSHGSKKMMLQGMYQDFSLTDCIGPRELFILPACHITVVTS
eukprot:scaffold63367_cov61-Attheya_sp.AAC.3